MYIYFSVFSLRVLFFLSYFFHFTLFFSPLILSRSFFPHTCFLSRKFIVSLFLSRCLEYSFQSTNSFPKSIVFFFSFLFFIRTVSRGLFSLCLRRSCLLLGFSSRLIPRVPSGFSDSSFKIVLPSLSNPRNFTLDFSCRFLPEPTWFSFPPSKVVSNTAPGYTFPLFRSALGNFHFESLCCAIFYYKLYLYAIYAIAHEINFFFYR